MRFLNLLLISLFLSSCASLNRYYNFDQQDGKVYTKYRGQKIVRMEKVEDLKNAFGKKDIYGGKVDKGSLVVYYGGIKNGKAQFLFNDQDIKTNASVFTRYFKDTSTVNVTSYGNNATGTVTHNKAPKETREALPPDTYEILINLKDKKLEHDYFDLEIIKASESKIKYKFIQKISSEKIN